MVASIPRRGARRVLAALAAALLCPATAFPEDALPAGDAPAMADASAEAAPAPLAQPLSEPAAARAPGFKAGRVFRDCPHCPEMVVVPSGSFMMGSDEWPRRPVHLVTIGSPFAVGVYEVTFDEWDTCVLAGGCGSYRPDDAGWGRGRRPAINVTWDDAQDYVVWLSRETGESYRLLSESEWEYAARAGTTTRYWWGDDIGRNRANCLGCGSRWDGESTAPVGSFSANAFGLHDVHGNVREWVQDCWRYDYAGAPDDGSAWESGECSPRTSRGFFWRNGGQDRDWNHAENRNNYIGFRVARTLTP